MGKKVIQLFDQDQALLIQVKSALEKKWGKISDTSVVRRALRVLARAEGIKPEGEDG